MNKGTGEGRRKKINDRKVKGRWRGKGRKSDWREWERKFLTSLKEREGCRGKVKRERVDGKRKR